MEFWQRVHWFFTSKCNERCKFCFKPDFDEGSADNAKTLTNILTKNDVKEVVFTGGEPLISKNLDKSLEILRDNNINTSIHTNAILLTSDRVRDLTSLADEIAIPLDSMNRKTQEYLRNEDCLKQIKKVFGQLQDADVRIGIHTVATAINMKGVPKIYDFLCKGRFDYWKIYEFNPNLVKDRTKSVKRFYEVEKLSGRHATETDGGVRCLFADFLLMEEQMSRYKDKRVKFVGFSDYDRAPYFFLDSKGNAYMATWFSQHRKPIGNLLNEGFIKVRDRAIKKYSEGPLYDEDAFIETEQSQPLWVRGAWAGNYFDEEFDDLDPKYHNKFRHLSELYLDRIKKQGEAPKDAKLNYTIIC
ncbi:MAG: radical SAM protein [Candidatus Nanoarchaeia archaeon]|nr:radical SAM protein [Candidatus Nanoarchaeia archaeon]MDD5740372.1 radical SAM protein [Candidatus Nanoarchaeia archaeon]